MVSRAERTLGTEPKGRQIEIIVTLVRKTETLTIANQFLTGYSDETMYMNLTCIPPSECKVL